MNETLLRKSLNCIIHNEPDSIKAFVAKEALSWRNIKGFFINLEKRSCTSGMISTLNHYDQTHRFFNHYYDEIEALRMDIQKQTGTPVKITYDLKTSLSWFAFEQTAHQMANDLKIFDGGSQHD
ncbi:DUF7222 domain-containing protein [Tenacibaculum sp. ZS6-P6]|uniref:DUF7222 domain-containing protein n=1 Tax=Tenacibaculum sp. ZS6-P6 TaxID=3447503 RepID=UPI003F99BBBA